MRILVTGGSGFIGSALVRHLMSGREHRVRVLDKLTYAGTLSNFPDRFWKDRRFEFVRGDTRRRSLVREVLKGVDVVFNLAAETHIDRSVDNVDPFVMTDFVGAYVLLDEFRRRPCSLFVQMSTCEIYGTARQVPMDENHPIAPQSPYSATKAGADRMCHSFVETYGLPIVILRPFNIYGPHQYTEKLIPFFLTQAWRDQPLLVYGTGRSTRDWTHVHDCCAVAQERVEMESSKVSGEVFNIGSGQERDVPGIARAVLDYLGKSPSLLKRVKDRPGHVARLVCDTRKSRRARTSFNKGLDSTLDWYMANPGWWRRITRRRSCRDFYRRWCVQALGARV